MKQLAFLWQDMPRWARGLFLGNLGYILLAVQYYIALYAGLSWRFYFSNALLWPLRHAPVGSRIQFYHLAWCASGALFVQWLGEVKGMAVSLGLIFGVTFWL